MKLILGLADKVRSSSKNAIVGLEKQHVGAVMLTGDHQGPATLISKQVGLKDFHFSMKPNEKYEWLLKKQVGLSRSLMLTSNEEAFSTC